MVRSNQVAVWISALGQPELALNLVPSTKDWIADTLVTVGAEAFTDNRSSNESRRAKVVADLNDHLRWKSWDYVR